MEKDLQQLGIIILAAGKGTRMKSDKAKVLHEILGKPMILYAADTAYKVVSNRVVMVVGHQGEKVREVVSEKYDISFAYQKDQLGTGHAVMCALPELNASAKRVIIMCGDSPLVSPLSIYSLLEKHVKENRDVTILGVILSDPTGYGRIMKNSTGKVIGVVEEVDADSSQKKIRMINSGIYCVERSFLETALTQIKSNNRQKEFYLTDILGIGYREGKSLGVVVGEVPEEARGVNSRSDLKWVEDYMYRRI